MNDTPRDREPVRRVPADPPQPYITETITPKHDIFPYVMGALIAALVVGFGVVVFLLGGPGNTSVAPVPTPITNAPAGVPTTPSEVLPSTDIPNPEPTSGAGSSNDTASSQTATSPSGTSPVATVQLTVPAGSTEGDVPRISMDEFKALYDDPATRPVIIDVRSKEGYDAGHIKGSIAFPEDQIATLVSDLPKDKLVVAYCSWPAENSSARVALKLQKEYGYSFENLKALQGGWGVWSERNTQDAQGYPIEPWVVGGQGSVVCTL